MSEIVRVTPKDVTDIPELRNLARLKAAEFIQLLASCSSVDEQLVILMNKMIEEEREHLHNPKLQEIIDSPIVNLKENSFYKSHPFQSTQQFKAYICLQAGSNPYVYELLCGMYASVYYKQRSSMVPLTLQFVVKCIGTGKLLQSSDLFMWWKSALLDTNQSIYVALPFTEYFTYDQPSEEL